MVESGKGRTADPQAKSLTRETVRDGCAATPPPPPSITGGPSGPRFHFHRSHIELYVELAGAPSGVGGIVVKGVVAGSAIEAVRVETPDGEPISWAMSVRQIGQFGQMLLHEAAR